MRGPHAGMVLNEVFEGDGDILFAHACKLGCEGIVSKRVGSLYRSGRSPHWLKVKNPKAPAVKREAEEDWGSAHWPSSRSDRADSAVTASTASGNRAVKSLPWRVIRRTPASSRRAIMRMPSCLISCSQFARRRALGGRRQTRFDVAERGPTQHGS